MINDARIADKKIQASKLKMSKNFSDDVYKLSAGK